MKSAGKFLCIHGHFYQPPRESPWLEHIGPQESAYPYHDWNERINAECFAPNVACRILDDENRIVRIVNNYARMSFNFGPTLLSWLENHASEVYRGILKADRESQESFGGHGSAIAQAYNHAILPLAPERLKRLQVRWGIADFQHRFGRQPRGFWLPETAVDLPTLEVLASEGIEFTLLAPHQARRIRRIGETEWQNLDGESINPRRSYLLKLPSGKSIGLFFYDGPTSRAVAFEGLLRSGEGLLARLLSRYSTPTVEPELVHIASDGETYGHHQRFGEMALAWALDQVASGNEVQLTNYSQFLSLYPPTWEVEIDENTSWSCAHGVGRWKDDCGCSSGAHRDWNQRWRKPLRQALDQLLANLDRFFERRGSSLLADPWTALEEYVAVLIDRSAHSLDSFLKRHAKKPLSPGERVQVLKLLEIQRFLSLSFTSCGWFFDDISGIETRHILQCAARALQLSQSLSPEDFEGPFVSKLAEASSNIPEHGDGAAIYQRWGKGSAVDLLKVGANYALCSLFEEFRDRSRVYVFEVNAEDQDTFQMGRARLAVGSAQIRSTITEESETVLFGAISMGNHTLQGGVQRFRSDPDYRSFKQDIESAFERADFPEIIRLLDRTFGTAVCSLESLFLEEQQQILRIVLQSTLSEVEASLSSIYRRHNPLMRYLEHHKVAVPQVLSMTAQFVVNHSLRTALRAEEIDLRKAGQLLDEARRHKIELDTAGLSYDFQTAIEKLAAQAFREVTDGLALERLAMAIELMESSQLEANLWKVQNRYYGTLRAMQNGALEVEPSKSWKSGFLGLARKLSVTVPEEYAAGWIEDTDSAHPQTPARRKP